MHMGPGVLKLSVVDRLSPVDITGDGLSKILTLVMILPQDLEDKITYIVTWKTRCEGV